MEDTVSNNTDDKALIEDFLKGSKAAFEKLVIKYQSLVFNVCKKMLGIHEEALDVAQDVFVKLYENIKNFRFDSKFSTYLYAITVNACRNRQRVLWRQKKYEAYSLDEPVETEDGIMKRQIAAQGQSPREVVADKEIQEKLLKELHTLKEEFREILILKEFEGLRYDEISSILSIDIGTVKSRLSRARQALHKRLRGII